MRRTRLFEKAVAGALTVALSGCAQVQRETRVERGPSLRTFDREGAASPGGVALAAQPKWPTLTLSLSSFEQCRTEKVEEYVEERVTEVTAPAAGPALGTGVTATLVGAGLWAASAFLSNQPNTRTIDAAGNYGPSDRRIASTWGTVLLVVGVPALATAALQLAQTGEKTEQRKVESVIGAGEARCHAKPVSGTLQTGRGPSLTVTDGKVDVPAEALAGLDLSALSLNGAEVDVSPEALAAVEAYRACTRALPVPAAEAFGGLEVMALAGKVEDARTCRQVPGAPAEEALRAYEGELEARRERGEARAGPKVGSFDEALAAYPPTLRITEDSPEVAALDNPDAHEGEAALVRGVLQAWVEPNIARVDVGPRRAWLFVEGGLAKMGKVEAGSRVEAVVVMAGRQHLGAEGLPVLRVIWMRPAL